jgi:hypothetical protein
MCLDNPIHFLGISHAFEFESRVFWVEVAHSLNLCATLYRLGSDYS